MKKRKVLISGSLLILMSFVLLGNVIYEENDNFSERVKIALRDVGNKLLMADGDRTSLILPVVEMDKNNFELSFQNKLSILPDSLVSILSHSLRASNLPDIYIVEVIDGETREVSYSYEVRKNSKKNVVPCQGRKLPYDNYKIRIIFTGQNRGLVLDENYTMLPLVMISFIGFGLLYWKKEKSIVQKERTVEFSEIGTYKFYREQNKLVKGNAVIDLTPKECELITLFAEKPNQIIKRDLLVKKIWEDNGVFVGRSLDTFISKIRKKLKHDDSIKIISVHGVGYKLEIL